MARGRKAAPTALKVLKGTRGDRVNRAEPRPPAGRPEAPEHLDLEALGEWNRIVPLLEGMGVLATVDGAALALYCDSYSRWVAANEEVVTYGLLVETGMAGLKANPAVAIGRAAMAHMHRLLTEFGCTPASRARLKAAPERQKDELGEFLGAKKAR